jgi:hypothetical protein
MTIETLGTIKNWFKTGSKPTQAQFWSTWDSFWHKEEKIPINAIENIETILSEKSSVEALENHLTDASAHAELFEQKVDAAVFDDHLIDINAHAALFSEKENKKNKGVADGYAPLNEFVKITHEYLNIVNDLVTGGENVLLSAEQGKVLQKQIKNINILLASDNVNLDNVQELVDAIETIQMSLSAILVNDLTTGGITKALTAEMGKTLKGLIDGLTAIVSGKQNTLISATNIKTINGTSLLGSGDIVIERGSSPGLQSVLDTSPSAIKRDSYIHLLKEFPGNQIANQLIINNGIQQTALGQAVSSIGIYSAKNDNSAEARFLADNQKISIEQRLGQKVTSIGVKDPTNNTTINFPAKSINGNYTVATLDDIDVGYLEKTKEEIDILITNNQLIAGALYKITGVHPTLYNDGTNSGTTIYLQALTTNMLAKEGYGEFWNPKYDQSIEGFGVYQYYSTYDFNIATLVGVFEDGDTITANNGATGTTIGVGTSGVFLPISGNWESASSMSNEDGASVDIYNIEVPIYNLGTKTIWGGYSWTNLNGNAGSKTDILNLNYDWVKNEYSEDNYNKVIDIIEYDYTNDWISRRYEVEGNNNIIYTFADKDYIGERYSAISVFMFGNKFDANEFVGIGNNQVLNSYFESVDFRGSVLYDNELDRSKVSSNVLIRGSITATVLMDSEIITNIIKDSFINTCIIQQYSSIEGVIFTEGTSFGSGSLRTSIIRDTLFINCPISSLLLDGSIIITSSFLNTGIGANYLYNSRIGLGFSNMVSNKNIREVTFDSVEVTQNLNSSTLLDGDYYRTVYSRPDGTPKIKYYNNSDVLVIADITD